MKLNEAKQILNDNGYELLEDVYDVGISDLEYASAINFLYDNKFKKIQKILENISEFVNKNCYEYIDINENEYITNGFKCEYISGDKNKKTLFENFVIKFNYTPITNLLITKFARKKQSISKRMELIIECDKQTNYKLMLRNVTTKDHYYYVDYNKFIKDLKNYILNFIEDIFNYFVDKGKNRIKNYIELHKMIEKEFSNFK